MTDRHPPPATAEYTDEAREALVTRTKNGNDDDWDEVRDLPSREKFLTLLDRSLDVYQTVGEMHASYVAQGSRIGDVEAAVKDVGADVKDVATSVAAVGKRVRKVEKGLEDVRIMVRPGGEVEMRARDASRPDTEELAEVVKDAAHEGALAAIEDTGKHILPAPELVEKVLDGRELAKRRTDSLRAEDRKAERRRDIRNFVLTTLGLIVAAIVGGWLVHLLHI
jgi:hypothetical protein